MLILVYMSILQCYISCSGLPMLLEEHYSCSPGVYFWIKSSKVTLSGNLLSCWKKTLYQDIVVKNDENSTYQELDVSDSTYQNTAIP